MEKYADMLHMPRPVSRKHPPMSNANRAKQFMPFAALRGYGEAIAAREVERQARSLLSEEDAELLDGALRGFAEALRRGERPEVTLEFFEAGSDGETGRYRSFTGRLDKLSPELGELRAAGRTFALGDIIGIWREDGV